MGHANMRLDTLADMAWALDCAISVQIGDVPRPSISTSIDSETSSGGAGVDAKTGGAPEVPRGINNGFTLVPA
jgi:hypothetical protein